MFILPTQKINREVKRPINPLVREENEFFLLSQKCFWACEDESLARSKVKNRTRLILRTTSIQGESYGSQFRFPHVFNKYLHVVEVDAASAEETLKSEHARF